MINTALLGIPSPCSLALPASCDNYIPYCIVSYTCHKSRAVSKQLLGKHKACITKYTLQGKLNVERFTLSLLYVTAILTFSIHSSMHPIYSPVKIMNTYCFYKFITGAMKQHLLINCWDTSFLLQLSFLPTENTQ